MKMKGHRQHKSFLLNFSYKRLLKNGYDENLLTDQVSEIYQLCVPPVTIGEQISHTSFIYKNYYVDSDFKLF